jgi:hypothetical protein
VFNIFCLRFSVDCKSLINGFLVLVLFAIVCWFFFFFQFFFIRTGNLLKAGPFCVPTLKR